MICDVFLKESNDLKILLMVYNDFYYIVILKDVVEFVMLFNIF